MHDAIENFFFITPDKFANPYPDIYYFLENEPVFFCKEINVWFVFKYDDVVAAYKDDRLSNERLEAMIDGIPDEELKKKVLPMVNTLFADSCIMQDKQEHRRLRKAINGGFTPKVVNSIRDLIEKIAHELLEKHFETGEMDFAQDYAHILPVAVLCHLFGISQQDRDKVRHWADDIANFFNDMPVTNENAERLIKSGEEMQAHVTALVESRRQTATDDYLGEIVTHGDLSNEELISSSVLLLLAGHETTRNLIGNMIHLLLTHPNQFELVKQNKGLHNAVVEEALRIEAVHSTITRLAKCDVELRGKTIKKGDYVFLCNAAANHDSDIFSEPDKFNIERKLVKNLAFGTGPHLCMGAHLARMEALVTLEKVLELMPNIRLDADKPIVFQHTVNLRGPKLM